MLIIDIERLPNETESEYHKRIIYGKLVDKTLSDIDYTELSEIVYGQPYSSDVARRMFYGSCRTLQELDGEAVNACPVNIKNDLDRKIEELQKETQRFYDQRREYKKILAGEGRREHIYERLAKAAEHLSETVGNVFADKYVCDSEEQSEAVLVLSDWHYGMTTDNVFNKYNTTTCKARVADITDQAIKKIILNKCKRLHIVVLGDMCHGAIHVSARVASEELVSDQIMQVSEVLAQTIFELSKYVEETKVYITYGNHARTVAKKNDNIHRDNMERLIPWWIEQRIKAEELRSERSLNISVEQDSGSEFLFIDACGHEICACHGDLDSVKSSPRLLSTLFHKKFGKDIEYIILGDKHHKESFEEMGVTASICGSLCGSDEYSNIKRLYSTPSQLLLIANQDGIDTECILKTKI